MSDGESCGRGRRVFVESVGEYMKIDGGWNENENEERKSGKWWVVE